MLTGVKDPPSELGIPARNIQEEAPDDFGLPPQENAFDLVDTPSLQDFLGGDINISTGDDLTGDSLLEEVRDAYYDETASANEKDLE